MNVPESHLPDTRRKFLKKATDGVSVALLAVATGAAGGALCERAVTQEKGKDEGKPPRDPAGAGKAPAAAPPPQEDDSYHPHDHRWVFLIDVDKCIGCGGCVRACERENGVPEQYFRTWVERYRFSRGGEVMVDSPQGARNGFEPKVSDREITKAFFVPKLCNHCTATPCVQLCPVGASYLSPDGVIMVDEQRCIGCGYCVQACPYGSRFIHPETHVASKCTFCYHRITKGLPTACVQMCPTGARRFGDTMKAGDPVAEDIARKKVSLLKPELLTEPNCYYLGLTSEVR